MRYLGLRLSCLLHRHEWREITTPHGPGRRCRRCFTERADRVSPLQPRRHPG